MRVSFGTNLKLWDYSGNRTLQNDYSEFGIRKMFRKIVPREHMPEFIESMTELDTYLKDDGKNRFAVIENNQEKGLSFVDLGFFGINLPAKKLIEYIKDGTLINRLIGVAQILN